MSFFMPPLDMIDPCFHNWERTACVDHLLVLITRTLSGSKKDPGIPNNFPFKEQLLQQIADQKMKAQEEKEKQKEARRKAAEKARKAKKGKKTHPSESAKTNNNSTDGVLSKAGKRKAGAAEVETKAKRSKTTTASKENAKAAAEEDDEEDVDEDAPYNFAEHFATSKSGDEEDEDEEADEADEEEDDEEEAEEDEEDE